MRWVYVIGDVGTIEIDPGASILNATRKDPDIVVLVDTEKLFVYETPDGEVSLYIREDLFIDMKQVEAEARRSRDVR